MKKIATLFLLSFLLFAAVGCEKENQQNHSAIDDTKQDIVKEETKNSKILI